MRIYVPVFCAISHYPTRAIKEHNSPAPGPHPHPILPNAVSGAIAYVSHFYKYPYPISVRYPYIENRIRCGGTIWPKIRARHDEQSAQASACMCVQYNTGTLK